jgi:AcrR family transcriptional regulator
MVEVAAGFGLAAASPAAVSAAAGLPRSAFNRYFQGRSHCFAVAFDSLADELFNRVAARCEGHEDPALATVEALLDFALRHQLRAVLIFCESLAAGPGARARRDRLIGRIADLLEASLQARGDAERLDMPTEMLVGGIFRLVAMRLCSKPGRLAEMNGDLSRWISTYRSGEERMRWRASGDLGRPRTWRAPTLGEDARELRSEEDALLHALAALVFEKGYHAVGVDEVAAAAGISRGTFYRRFKDKREAMRGGAELAYEMMMGASARVYFVDEPWPERIWRVSMTVHEFLATEPALAHLLFVGLAALRLGATRLARQRMLAGALMLEEGYALNPPLAPMRTRLTEALATATLELTYRQVPRRGVAWLPDLRGESAYLCLAPFVGAEHASEFVAAKLDELDAESSESRARGALELTAQAAVGR